MNELVLFKVKVDEGPFPSVIHVVARGYDHAEQLAIEYLKARNGSDDEADFDATFVLSIKRIADTVTLSDLVICDPAKRGQLRPVG